MNIGDWLVPLLVAIMSSWVSIYGTRKLSKKQDADNKSKEFSDIIQANTNFREEIRNDLKIAREEIIELKTELENARVAIKQLTDELVIAKHTVEQLKNELAVKDKIITKLASFQETTD